MPDDGPRDEFSPGNKQNSIITQAIEAETPEAKSDFQLEFEEFTEWAENIFLEVFFYHENTLVIHFCFNGQDKTYVGVLNGRNQKITQFVYFKDEEWTSDDFNFDELTIKQFAEVSIEWAENIIEILSAQENIPTEVGVEVTERLLISGAEAREPDTLRWGTAAVEAARASIAAVNTNPNEGADTMEMEFKPYEARPFFNELKKQDPPVLKVIYEVSGVEFEAYVFRFSGGGIFLWEEGEISKLDKVQITGFRELTPGERGIFKMPTKECVTQFIGAQPVKRGKAEGF